MSASAPKTSQSQSLPSNLWTSVWDVAAYSMMVGLGESYLAAYAMAIGLNERTVGLISVIPVMLGSVLQLLAPLAIRRLRSRQRWIVRCAIVQALSLAYIGFVGTWIKSKDAASGHLFVGATIYWTAALAAGPAWNSWITGIVPEKVRLRFFTIRTQVGQFATLLGLIGAGVMLEFCTDFVNRRTMFFGLFLAAAVFRCISARLLHVQLPKIKASEAVINELSRPLADRRLFESATAVPTIWFMFFTNIAVQISGPFFTPYMIDELHVGYLQYMILLAATFVGRVVSAHFLAGVIAARGVRTLMLFGAVGIIPIPALWCLSDGYYYVLSLQFIAGIVWGAHELGFTMVLIEQLHEDERARVLTATNVFNSVGMLCGSSLGAVLLASNHPSQSDYFKIFACSALFRLLPLLILPKMINLQVSPRAIFFRVIGVRSGSMAVSKPVVIESTEDKN